MVGCFILSGAGTTTLLPGVYAQFSKPIVNDSDIDVEANKYLSREVVNQEYVGHHFSRSSVPSVFLIV